MQIRHIQSVGALRIQLARILQYLAGEATHGPEVFRVHHFLPLVPVAHVHAEGTFLAPPAVVRNNESGKKCCPGISPAFTLTPRVFQQPVLAFLPLLARTRPVRNTPRNTPAQEKNTSAGTCFAWIYRMNHNGEDKI